MADLLDLSSRIIDGGITDQAVNRVTNELSVITDDIAVVESFSHCVAFDTGDGPVAFDASGVLTGAAVVDALGTWRPTPPSHLVYTHGHADHVGGSAAFAAAAERAGRPRPFVIGHRHVSRRLDRYAFTNDWNLIINNRQFGGVTGDLHLGLGGEDESGVPVRASARRFLPTNTLRPEREIDDHDTVEIGGLTFDLYHDIGETDDHLWAWVPAHRALVTGDFVIWNFPNAGNPQKVQRYPLEWAAALRRMAAMGAELLLPAHGLPISGSERIRTVLGEIAGALEDLVHDVVAMMNGGATLDEIVHTVRVPSETLAKPYLRPLYDEPEFVVRNVWRLYGGWWDGAASRLKPSPDRMLAAAIAEMVGGATALLARAETAAEDGDLRLACHFADLAGWAAPDDPLVHDGRARIYLLRRKSEPSLMSKGIFAAAARESRLVADGPVDGPVNRDRG